MLVKEKNIEELQEYSLKYSKEFDISRYSSLKILVFEKVKEDHELFLRSKHFEISRKNNEKIVKRYQDEISKIKKNSTHEIEYNIQDNKKIDVLHQKFLAGDIESLGSLTIEYIDISTLNLSRKLNISTYDALLAIVISNKLIYLHSRIEQDDMLTNIITRSQHAYGVKYTSPQNLKKKINKVLNQLLEVI